MKTDGPIFIDLREKVELLTPFPSSPHFCSFFSFSFSSFFLFFYFFSFWSHPTEFFSLFLSHSHFFFLFKVRGSFLSPSFPPSLSHGHVSPHGPCIPFHVSLSTPHVLMSCVTCFKCHPTLVASKNVKFRLFRNSTNSTG